MAESFWKVEWEPSTRELCRRAKEEAAAIGDDFLGTEHLLLAAVAGTPVEPRIAALSTDSVRAAVIAVLEPRSPGSVTITPWSQTPRLKLAIEWAMRRAFADRRPVCCLDLCLGMLADPESAAGQVLRHLQVGAEELRKGLSGSAPPGERLPG